GAAVQGPVRFTSDRPVGAGSVTITFSVSEGPRFVTTIVYSTLAPREPVAGPVFVTSRSARLTIGAEAAATLLPMLMSGTPSGGTTTALLPSMPVGVSAGRVPTTVKVMTDPTGSEITDESAVVPDAGEQVLVESTVQVQVTFVSAGVVPLS